MLQFAFQDFPVDEPHWTGLIAPVVILIVAVSVLLWLFRYLSRAMLQGKQCLDQSTTGIEIARESIEISRQAIEVQRETNQLLADLNKTLKQRPPS